MSKKSKVINFAYQNIFKPLLFLCDPEKVHNRFTKIGSLLGKNRFTRKLLKSILRYNNLMLRQNLFGVEFINPIGLSAGFDYDGYMTEILGSVGFGFESMGTVTYKYYEGNKKPRLVRLPKSRSLLVNKGFKSEGIKKVLTHSPNFEDKDINIGISIGATNSPETSTSKTQIEDILSSFKYLTSHKKAENFAYYELNISCPNVLGVGTLAEPKQLREILFKIREIGIKKPLFVKFQLEIDWRLARELIEIMIEHKVDAIILSNLLKNKENFEFKKQEIEKIIKKDLKGNFSGKCTQELSNELISKTYKEFGDRIKIIGVGGVFCAEDAYEKIKRGASLVGLITGMIYEGPQVVGEINEGLARLLKEDGYKNISEAIGVYHRS